MSTKCVIKDQKIVSTCDVMTRCIDTESNNKRKRGICVFNIYNKYTGDISRQFICINKTDSYPDGIVLNTCPFCGEPLNISSDHTNLDY